MITNKEIYKIQKELKKIIENGGSGGSVNLENYYNKVEIDEKIDSTVNKNDAKINGSLVITPKDISEEQGYVLLLNSISKKGLKIDNDGTLFTTGNKKILTADDLSNNNDDIFRRKGSNIICGLQSNDVANDLSQCIISGGGGANGRENIIGGNLDNVNTSLSNAAPMQTGTGANLSRILGGYDNVINGLSSQISSDHCKIGNKATHCSIIGGANHWIKDNVNFSSINGGVNNTIDGSYSVIGSGSNNTITATTSVISGGSDNKIDGIGTFIGGGARNQTNGIYNTIAGGNKNTINATGSTISGGVENSITKNYSTIVGGFKNKANGDFSTVIGGMENEANGPYSYITGVSGVSKYKGERVHSSGKFSIAGDCQVSELILGLETTSSARGWLNPIGTSTTTNLIENSTLSINVNITARTNNGESCAMFNCKALVSRTGTGASFIVSTPIVEKLFSLNAETWRVEIIASGHAFFIYVYGEDNKNIKWIGDLRMSQLIG